MKAKLGAFAVALTALALLPGAAGAATINPNTTDDEFDDMAPLGDCALREAIQSAVTNAAFGGCVAGDGGTDTINLTASILDPYEQILGTSGDDDNEEGDFDIDGGGPIVIKGTNFQSISTLALDRIFDLNGSGANLTLEHVVVEDGNVANGMAADDQDSGGNIRVNDSATLKLDDGAGVADGRAVKGGGIWADGTSQVTIRRSFVDDNVATRRGGGLSVTGSGLGVQISESFIRGNYVTTDDDVVGNLEGGGIVFSGQQMTISDSSVADNSILHEGTAAGDGALGGGISASSNTTVRRSLIENNKAEAENGNEERGGALIGEAGDSDEAIRIVNSTIYNNTAGNMADASGEGGAIFLKQDGDPDPDIDASLSHVTVSNNDAAGSAGDALETASPADTGVITVRASILSPSALGVNLCEGTSPPDIVSAGFNVTSVADPQCSFGGTDSVAASPTGLAAGGPVDNGGDTNTIGLVAGGRAVDFVPAAECGPAEGQDQRGFFRPSGAACDAGAYERVTCSGIVQEGPGAVDCPPPPVVPIATPTSTPIAAVPVTTAKKKCKKGRKLRKGKCRKKKKKRK